MATNINPEWRVKIAKFRVPQSEVKRIAALSNLMLKEMKMMAPINTGTLRDTMEIEIDIEIK